MLSLAVISYEDIRYFVAALLLVLLGLFAIFLFSWWKNHNFKCPCPYTGHPLRRGSDLHYMTKEKVLRYLFDLHDYHNRMFDLNRAAVGRITGRIFPDAINWYGRIRVKWNFLQKRYPGNFISWGSLSEQEKLTIMDKHATLEGFQTEFSSSRPSPRKIEPDYAFKKPGPLYVDVDSGVLLGWKCIPDTELEVLIVQKPQKVYIPGLHKI